MESYAAVAASQSRQSSDRSDDVGGDREYLGGWQHDAVLRHGRHGQGSDTAMAQMVGEVLNIPAETVRVVPRDTE